MRSAARRAAAAAVLLCAAAAGCGAPGELSAPEGRALTEARGGIDEALDTAEALRTSDEETRRIVREVREIVSRGVFETERLDEFGVAALGELAEVVPSLVERSANGTPRQLDRPATRAFLALAADDPARALVIPASEEVAAIERTVGGSDADAETVLPGPSAPRDQPLADFLDETVRDTRPVWPELAERLERLRSGLDG